MPAFGIYGNDVCDADDTEIPETFARNYPFRQSGGSGGYNARQVVFTDRLYHNGYRRLYN
ncbi:MAG: hypothetical protein ACLR56_08250 [Oscillospiraceae bacterium]